MGWDRGWEFGAARKALAAVAVAAAAGPEPRTGQAAAAGVAWAGAARLSSC